MCFSPQADVVAGIAITVVAVDAVRHCRSARTAPLAALPAIFAFHTFMSALVWWGLMGTIPAGVGESATQVYLGIAFVLLPVYVPIAILLIEPRGWRRIILGLLTLAGAYAAADFLIGLANGRGYSTQCSYYVDFNITGASGLAGALYVVATCGALLISGKRPIMIWGILNVIGVGLLVVVASRGLPSLWCFWAACTSFFIAWYLRSIDTARDKPPRPAYQAPSPVP